MPLKSARNILRILLVFCSMSVINLPSLCRAGETLKIGGMGSGLGVMKLLVEAFMTKQPGTGVQVLPSLGSAGGFKALSRGAIDIGVAARPLKDGESKWGISVAEYAKSPFVVITRRDNPLSGLNMDELAMMYGGSVLTWPDGKRLRPVLRPEEDIDTKIARGMSPQMDRAVTAAMSREGMLVAITDQDAVKSIETTPGAVGFSTLAQTITERLPVKILSLDGVAPTVAALSKGSYKYSKPLFIAVRPEASATVRDFLDFVESPEGIRILQESGYVITLKKSGK
jgi:phosphate transport system substrate-binding protein